MENIQVELKLLDEHRKLLFEKKFEEYAKNYDNSEKMVEGVREKIPTILQEVLFEEVFKDEKTTLDKMSRIKMFSIRFEIAGQEVYKEFELK